MESPPLVYVLIRYSRHCSTKVLYADDQTETPIDLNAISGSPTLTGDAANGFVLYNTSSKTGETFYLGSLNRNCGDTSAVMNGGALYKLYGGGKAMGNGIANAVDVSITLKDGFIYSFHGGGHADGAAGTAPTANANNVITNFIGTINNTSGGHISYYNGGYATRGTAHVVNSAVMTMADGIRGTGDTYNVSLYGGGRSSGAGSAANASECILNLSGNITNSGLFIYAGGSDNLKGAGFTNYTVNYSAVFEPASAANCRIYGGGSASAVANSVININGGVLKELYASGVNGGGNVTGSSVININGGTVSNVLKANSSNAQVTAASKTLNIPGGAILIDNYNPDTDMEGYTRRVSATDTKTVYPVKLTLEGGSVANKKITGLALEDGSGLSYDTANMYANASGIFTVMLPAGVKILSANSGENRYDAPAGGITAIASSDPAGYASGTLTQFIAVTGIEDVPSNGTVETSLELTASVSPANATNKDIVWSLTDAGTTGAQLSGGNVLSATAGGTVTVTATIADGADWKTPYTKDFDIAFSYPAINPITNITGVQAAAYTLTDIPLMPAVIVPEGATYKTIIWSLVSGGTTATGVTLKDDVLYAETAGNVRLEARIVKGISWTKDYVQTFNTDIPKS